RERGARFLTEFDGARAIEESEALVHELDSGSVHFDAHPVRARFRRCIAHCCFLRHLALALNRAEAEEYGLKQGCLAAQIGSHECDAPRTPTFSAICCGVHSRPPFGCVNAVRGPPILRGNPVGAAPRVLCLRRFSIMTSPDSLARAVRG